MDVNGAEMGVIRHNLLPLLQSRRIEHFFCEFDVAAWPKFHPPGTPTSNYHPEKPRETRTRTRTRTPELPNPRT